MLKVVDTLVQALAAELGDQLEAVYLFGSLAQGHYVPGESDINLFVTVRDGSAFPTLQQAFFPLWQRYQNELKRAPFMATKGAFLRHLQLNPLLAQQLIRDGQQLLGPPEFLDRRVATIEPHEAYAYLVTEAMQASAALAPELLGEETAVTALSRLRRLARRLRNEPLPEGETAVQTFARIQHFLAPIIASLPAARKVAGVVPKNTTTPLLPGLQTIYNEGSKTVLVFTELWPQKIIQTDWSKLAARLPERTTGLELTTVEQMSLSIMFDRPLDLRFKKLQHAWGPNFLAAFNPTTRQIMRYSARVPSRILIDELPHVYLTHESSEEVQHKIIHDFQNKMLNVQLEHELLVRYGLVERFKPPTPVPGREMPAPQRVAALFQHLEWWADFYIRQL
ncbi:MAG: nucleotidyltransferase domain-containing protein [Anaerolineae bacterium]|nr:nucleotidyltransferase domain-containing protein [Anaerolineae bacterium]